MSKLCAKKGSNHFLKSDLIKSEKIVGQLIPVLRDAEGKVIDGYHRLDVDPNWRSVTLEDVKTEEERLIVSVHVNMSRRKITNREKAIIINQLAEIYYDQGLRPDARKDRVGKDNNVIHNVHFNEIKHKIAEVLDGAISPNEIKNLLSYKYKNKSFSDAKKEYNKNRREMTSPYSLLKSSHGVQLRKTYGEDFFKRLEEEMLQRGLKEAKSFLRNSLNFRREIEADIKKKYDESIRIIIKETEERVRSEIRSEVESELGLVVA